jgi:CRP-like cAMP-binding protein
MPATPASKEIFQPVGNRLLAALSPGEHERFFSRLEMVYLPQSKILYSAGDIINYTYFPLNGMISLLSVTEDGRTMEVAMVGNEGAVGIPVILRALTTPHETIVQIPARAMRIRASLLREEFDRGGRLQDVLLRYTNALLLQVSQSPVCNYFHTVEQRLCRWLLITRDCLQSDTFYLTQELISQMLGAPRSAVTVAAGQLQKKGLIRYSRGKITILNQKELSMAACECYRIVAAEMSSDEAA